MSHCFNLCVQRCFSYFFSFCGHDCFCFLLCCFSGCFLARFTVEGFIAYPTVEALSSVTRNELTDSLSAQGVFGEAEKVSLEIAVLSETADRPTTHATLDRLVTPSKAELELCRLELEIGWERLEADRQVVRDQERREHELKIKDF